MEAITPRLAYDFLPEGYKQTAEFNLRHNTRMMVILNIAGFLLFLGAVVCVEYYTRLVRPMYTSGYLSFEVNNLGQVGLFLLFLAIDFLLLVILHEGTHGACFRLITGKRPTYSLGPGYAYAAAPEVYIKKKPYLVTAVSPLVALTITGMILIPFVPKDLLFHVTLITVMNIAGAVGDLWVASGVVFKSEPILIQDSGDRVVVFQQERKPA
jgi:hypothetical protein